VQVDKFSGLGNELVDSFSRQGGAQLEQQVLAEGGQRQLSDVVGFMDTAGGQSDRSFDAAEGIYERQTRALGTRGDATQQAAAQRRIGLSRALSSVDARNRSVGELRQRTDIARSGASDLRSMVEGSMVAARGSAAQMEGGREADYVKAKAEHKAKKAAGLGQIASMAAMFIPGVGPIVSPMIGAAVTKAAS
jgi:hypothetical protein